MVRSCQALGAGGSGLRTYHADQPRGRPLDGQPRRSRARVKVTRKGAIFLDGRRATLDDFRQTCDRLHKEGGAVLYYREDPESEPHEIATQVIQAVIDARLPIKLCENDFDQPGSEDGEFVYPE